ncbi:hypothetical protein DOM22_05285 [Bdellovibrio sp. ZAP7]|uniref:hypothetical protein n=1 Tax=Bdellovibrio sp. ZAP7 TaxID=2231053 RepID=UPI001157C4BD|nr:hypothetical protein [Bdellovibrio sp. ZAP7]QDK44614.1 hypothetical protein DOM22_05285 [Bdellovibrio sp. ZAP7]
MAGVQNLEWTEWKKRMDKYLLSIVDAPDEVWDKEYYDKHLDFFLDIDRQRHLANSCLIQAKIQDEKGLLSAKAHLGQLKSRSEVQVDDGIIPGTLTIDESPDDFILELIGMDLFWIYDPCVIQRIAQADLHSDKSFLIALGKRIGSSVTKTADAREFSTLRLFLSELDRLGIICLYQPSEWMSDDTERRMLFSDAGVDNEEDFYSSEWDRAYEIVCDLLNSPSPLESFLSRKQFTNGSEFKKAFSKFFTGEGAKHLNPNRNHHGPAERQALDIIDRRRKSLGK